MWNVSSRSGVAALRTAIHLLLTYLLTYLVNIGSVVMFTLPLKGSCEQRRDKYASFLLRPHHRCCPLVLRRGAGGYCRRDRQTNGQTDGHPTVT